MVEKKGEKKGSGVGGGGGEGGKKRDKTESVVNVVYICTINYPLPELLIFVTGPV